MEIKNQNAAIRMLTNQNAAFFSNRSSHHHTTHLFVVDHVQMSYGLGLRARRTLKSRTVTPCNTVHVGGVLRQVEISEIVTLN